MRRGARLTVHTPHEQLTGGQPPLVVDVRTADEREAGAVPGSLHLPLAELPARHRELPTDRRLVLHRAGGSRSSIAAGLPRRDGVNPSPMKPVVIRRAEPGRR
ncbi:rhodanese-like domain-containing protein [Kitasatospora cathayae]|uniref:Rhodanese-like domain-containing protein n=1 Tax=Kitasatospora cathayae TaxID=3004092 RepID=A0ABY7PVP4_9ACTN|nr:rhodanese-like domain-containing protein [Kitasatospora sp. HUAS 3-15]WBP84421.1 rhodanese-like domain-containing protein [Kitasatospora sp. HUAS 3-15]